jgi:ESCRT-I complex subunit VPS28
LISNAHERQYYEPLSDLYSLLIATEGLERAYIRDAVSANDYTTACLKLIAQYKTVMNLVTKDNSGFDITLFIKQYKVNSVSLITDSLSSGDQAFDRYRSSSNSRASSG